MKNKESLVVGCSYYTITPKVSQYFFQKNYKIIGLNCGLNCIRLY